MPWNVEEITVKALYSNRAPDTLTIPCQSISEIPGGSKDHVPGSSFEYPRLTARGVNAATLQKLGWIPNRLIFRDLDTDKAHEFPVRLLDAYEDTAKFLVRH